MKHKDTKKTLIKAFEQLVTEKQTTNFSVIELCQKAKVHPQTFYFRFKSRKDFIRFYFRQTIEEDFLIPANPIASDLADYVQSLKNFSRNNRYLVINLVMNDSKRFEIISEFYEALMSSIIWISKSSPEKKEIFFYGSLGIMIQAVMEEAPTTDSKRFGRIFESLFGNNQSSLKKEKAN
jgi:AcrR family transcriptional regulator